MPEPAADACDQLAGFENLVTRSVSHSMEERLDLSMIWTPSQFPGPTRQLAAAGRWAISHEMAAWSRGGATVVACVSRAPTYTVRGSVFLGSGEAGGDGAVVAGKEGIQRSHHALIFFALWALRLSRIT